MNTGEKVARGIIYNAFGNIFVQIIGIITAIIIARTLGPELQGTYVLIVSIPVTINTFITLGWNQGLNRYIPALRGENKEGLITPILRRVFALRFILSIFAILFLILFSDLIESLFNIQGWLNWQVLTLISAYLVISNLSSILSMILTVNYQQRMLNFIHVLTTASMLLAVLGLVYFDFMNVESILFFTVILEILSFVCFLVVYKKSIVLPHDYNPEEFVEYIKKFSRYSSIMYLIQLAGFILAYRSDIYFIAYYLGATSVSFYSIANSFVDSSLHIFGARSTGTMIVGTMTEKYKQEGKGALNKVFSYDVQLVFLYSVPIISGGIFLAEDIVSVLYGADYMPVAPLLMVLFFIRLFTGFGGAYSGVLIALEKPQYFLWTKIISIINIPLDILLIPRIGVMGAVIATAITVMLTTYTEIFLTLRIISLKFPFKNVLKMLLCSSIMIAGIFFVKEFVNIDIMVKLALEITLGAFIYVFLVLNLDVLDKEVWSFMPGKVIYMLDKIKVVKG